MIDRKKVVVLAPHTDDGELGCGGTIAKYCNEGDEVFYVALSTCRRSLPEGWAENTLELEVKEATQRLGIKSENLIIYDYDVRTFKTERQNILEDFVKLNRRIKPDIVFLPSPTDIHQDHQAVSEEGIRAFKGTSILGYEMPWNNLSFNTRAFVELSEYDLEKKIFALQAYQSQLHRPYVTKEFLYSLARVRGVQMATEFAEAFEVIKLIL